jgi:hypothetical protein
MTVTVWQFLFNTNILFQGNVRFQPAAILKCDISLSEICVMNIRNRDFWVIWIVGCVIFSLKDCKIRNIGYGSGSQTFSVHGALDSFFTTTPSPKKYQTLPF